MERISKLTVSMKGLVPTITDLLERWSPPALRTEAQYRDHLVSFLRQALPNDARVEKEYRHLGTTIDVFVEWKGIMNKGEICFELKKDLRRKADFDRLVGQVEGMYPSDNNIVIVLIGETDASLLGRLKDRYADQMGDDIDEATLAIVSIDSTRRGGAADTDEDDDGW